MRVVAADVDVEVIGKKKMLRLLIDLDRQVLVPVSVPKVENCMAFPNGSRSLVKLQRWLKSLKRTVYLRW